MKLSKLIKKINVENTPPSGWNNYVIITDNKGKKRAFYNFHELIKYIDSFKMSFLPDNFTYTIHED